MTEAGAPERATSGMLIGSAFPIRTASGTTRHPTVEETAAFAATIHAGQTDQAGAPYVGHLMRVAAHLRRLFPAAGEAERHAVWLHDAIEDTGLTADELRRFGYAPEVVEIVEAVTRPPGGTPSYAAWIEALAASGNSGAIRVKIADLTDNADPARLRQLEAARAASLGKRYAKALDRLSTALAAMPLQADAAQRAVESVAANRDLANGPSGAAPAEPHGRELRR